MTRHSISHRMPHPARVALHAALLAGLCAAALVAPQVQAQGKTKAAPQVLGDGPARGRPLSQEQLRTCLAMQPRLEQQSETVTRAKAELDAARAEFERFDAQIKSTRATLDAGDKAAVDAYNAQLDQRQRMVTDYNARQPAFNQQAQAYNALQQSWASDCDDRPYDADDYAAVHRDR